MLSEQEKREILEDAKSVKRIENFRAAKQEVDTPYSLDEYTAFLDSVQKIFGPFKMSRQPTPTKFNRL